MRSIGINWNNYLMSDLTNEEQELLDIFLEKVKKRAESWKENQDKKI